MAKKEVEYTDEPLGELRIIDDFLPSPEQLVFQEEKVNVVLTLSKVSLDFSNREAEKYHTQPNMQLLMKMPDPLGASCSIAVSIPIYKGVR